MSPCVQAKLPEGLDIKLFFWSAFLQKKTLDFPRRLFTAHD